MLVCPDRECGYRKSVTQVTNARCPNCFKKMELRGEGENQMFACVCGYREKLSAFHDRYPGVRLRLTNDSTPQAMWQSICSSRRMTSL